MTTNQIINLDCRNEKNQEIIQKVLRQIKPLSKYSDEECIPFDMIEKAICVMSKRYMMRIRDFSSDVWSNKSETIWRAILINETNYKVIDYIYGVSLYEVFAKAAIRMYAEVKRGIKTRE